MKKFYVVLICLFCNLFLLAGNADVNFLLTENEIKWNHPQIVNAGKTVYISCNTNEELILSQNVEAFEKYRKTRRDSLTKLLSADKKIFQQKVSPKPKVYKNPGFWVNKDSGEHRPDDKLIINEDSLPIHLFFKSDTIIVCKFNPSDPIHCDDVRKSITLSINPRNDTIKVDSVTNIKDNYKIPTKTHYWNVTCKYVYKKDTLTTNKGVIKLPDSILSELEKNKKIEMQRLACCNHDYFGHTVEAGRIVLIMNDEPFSPYILWGCFLIFILVIGIIVVLVKRSKKSKKDGVNNPSDVTQETKSNEEIVTIKKDDVDDGENDKKTCNPSKITHPAGRHSDEEINQIKISLDEAHSTIENLKTENVTMQQNIDTLEHQKNNLNTQVNTLQQNNVSLQEKVDSLQTERDDLSEQVNTLQADNENLVDQINGVNQELRSEKAKYVELKGFHSREIRELSNQISFQNQTIQEKEKVICEVNAKMATLREDMRIAQNKCIDLQKQISSFDRQTYYLYKVDDVLVRADKMLQNAFLNVHNDNLLRRLVNPIVSGTEGLDSGMETYLEEWRTKIYDNPSLFFGTDVLKLSNEEVRQKIITDFLENIALRDSFSKLVRLYLFTNVGWINDQLVSEGFDVDTIQTLFVMFKNLFIDLGIGIVYPHLFIDKYDERLHKDTLRCDVFTLFVPPVELQSKLKTREYEDVVVDITRVGIPTSKLSSRHVALVSLPIF